MTVQDRTRLTDLVTHPRQKALEGEPSGAFVMPVYSPVKYKVYSFGKVSTRVGRRSPVSDSVQEQTACPQPQSLISIS